MKTYQSFEEYMYDNYYDEIHGKVRNFLFQKKGSSFLSSQAVPDVKYFEMEDFHIEGASFSSNGNNILDFRLTLTVEINIADAYAAMYGTLDAAMQGVTEQARCNLAPRLRMTVLYGVAQCRNGRVANTCNLSEDWVGYSTRYGDAAGDFSPLSHLTVQEVRAVGRALGLPDRFVDKTPIDGLCGKTDEENLGFTYAVLDRYIRTGVCEDAVIRAEIDRRHRLNKFKLEMFPAYPYPDGVVHNF